MVPIKSMEMLPTFILTSGTYEDGPSFFRWIQRFVTPAEYWHDPLDEATYKKSSVFLADINNERVCIYSLFAHFY